MTYLVISDDNKDLYLCLSNNFTNENDIKIINNSKLQKNISNLLWNLKFNPYTKGTSYLKNSITLAYINNSYLYDNKKLMKTVAQINNINEKAVRSSIDQTLYKLSIPPELNSFFYDNYDGGKPSLKLFIAECVSFLKSKDFNA